MSMPKGMTKDLYDAIWDEMSWQYYNLYKYPSVEDNARVSIGFLLKHIWKVYCYNYELMLLDHYVVHNWYVVSITCILQYMHIGLTAALFVNAVFFYFFDHKKYSIIFNVV